MLSCFVCFILDLESPLSCHFLTTRFGFQVRESIESTSYDFHGIPVAEIFFCCGFFLIYFIEEFVHCICDGRVHLGDEATLQVHRSVLYWVR